MSYTRNSFFKGEDFNGLPDAQRRARSWCLEDAGQRTHGTTRARLAEVFAAEEQALLLPVPEARYDLPHSLRAQGPPRPPHESLGAAVVAELATEFPPAALLLRSPFTNLAAVGREHYPFLPVNLLLRDRFEVVENLRKVTVPTTVVYGTKDSIVSPEQSRAVARSAPMLAQTVEVKGAGHNDLSLLIGDEVIDAVVDLAERIDCLP